MVVSKKVAQLHTVFTERMVIASLCFCSQSLPHSYFHLRISPVYIRDGLSSVLNGTQHDYLGCRGEKFLQE